MSSTNTNLKRHSRWGLISFGLGLLVMAIGFSMVLGLVISGEQSRWYHQFKLHLDSYLIKAPALHVVGLVFGIIGVCSKKSNRLFPVLGVILNTVVAAFVWLISVFVFSV